MEIVSWESAQKIVAEAMRKATADYRRPICVSVVDKYGFLVAFGRMDSTPLRSIEISRRKAYTAVRMLMPTDQFLKMLTERNFQAGYFGDDTLTALPGGNPLKDAAGNILGAVGVSGLAASEDQVITEAMAELMKAGKV
jgi:uncharacterized protein GlcG (DUF336 family)